MGMIDGNDPRLGGQGFVPPRSWQDYEFTERENVTIAKAATWAKVLAIVIFVQTGINLIQQLMQLNICGAIVGAAVALAIGIPFLQAGQSFSLVVHTQGNDVNHMMTAISKLGSAFLTRIIVTCIAAGLVLLAVLAFLAFLPAAMF